MKKNCIITACDRKYGDFLIEHWYESLRDSNDLDLIDVAVLDYGLSRAQKFYLEKQGVIVHPCVRDGHVVICRFRDMALLLEERPYEQAILSDSGDIIFQDSLSPLLESNGESFRAVTEDLKTAFTLFLTDEFFQREDKRAIKHLLTGKKMINAGFFAGPGDKMRELGRSVYNMILNKGKFGPDQLAVNYILYQEGFVEMDSKFNFVVATAGDELTIREGRFYGDGELIAVVHNTGNVSILRPVENFGYGPERNRLKRELMTVLKGIHSTSDTYYNARDGLKLRLRDLKDDLKKYNHKGQERLENLFSKFVEEIEEIRKEERRDRS